MRESVPGDVPDPVELAVVERAATTLVRELIATGDLVPLAAAVRAGEPGLDIAREALRMLAELDSDRLVQLALDVLADQE